MVMSKIMNGKLEEVVMVSPITILVLSHFYPVSTKESLKRAVGRADLQAEI
jgi:hypothetical protein